MARPKKKVPLDPPEEIRARERQKPVDGTVVLAKNNAGTIVKVLNEGNYHRWPDGVERCYAPCDMPVSEAIAKDLKNGIAEAYEFRWVNRSDRRMPFAAAAHWVPVTKKSNEVYCPFAVGDKTGVHINLFDTVLHKRDRAIGNERLNDKLATLDPNKYIERRNLEVQDEFASQGVKSVEQTFELSEKDAITASTPV